MTAATGKAGAYRLVIYGGAPPTASVFALDATAFAPPLATMRLSSSWLSGSLVTAADG